MQQIQTIGNIPVRVIEKEKGIKGVIYGVPMEMTETEILHQLKSQKVISVTRMTKRSRKETTENSKINHEQPYKIKSPATNIILNFDRPSLPPQIFLCFQVFQVKQYIPSPARCYKCQRYGHAAYHCRFKERCVRCGEPHIFEQCPQKDSPKCINCWGAHSAAYGGCDAAKTATEIHSCIYPWSLQTEIRSWRIWKFACRTSRTGWTATILFSTTARWKYSMSHPTLDPAKKSHP